MEIDRRKSKDPIIERVVDKFRQRSEVGYVKYGVTLMDDPTDLDGWLDHLQQEMMDAVNYIERAREELRRERAKNIEVHQPEFVTNCTYKYSCNCKTKCCRNLLEDV